MKPEEIAEAISKARRARNEPELPIEEILKVVNQTKSDMATGNLDSDTQRALSEFRRRDVEQKLKGTPIIVPIVWMLIIGAALYFVFR